MSAQHITLTDFVIDAGVLRCTTCDVDQGASVARAIARLPHSYSPDTLVDMARKHIRDFHPEAAKWSWVDSVQPINQLLAIGATVLKMDPLDASDPESEELLRYLHGVQS